MNQDVLNAKKETVKSISEDVKSAKSVIVAEYRGLTVAEISELRRNLFKQNAKMGVYKNSLVERAVTDLGYADLAEFLKGPNALITSDDPILGPKTVYTFARKHEKLVIKGGVVEGKVVDAKLITTLAKLPGREGLLSMLVSVLQGPVRSLACALDAVAKSKN